MTLRNDPNWHDVCAGSTISIRSAMEILERTGLQIVMVVDDNGYLLGIVTDGDLRKALLSDAKMETAIEKVMNRSPVTVSDTGDLFELEAVMLERKLSVAPVTVNGKAIGIVTLNTIRRDIKAKLPFIIMAGGRGQRLGKLTDNCPKPMVLLNGKPMLEHLIEEVVRQGFRNIFITVNYLKESIESYFGDGNKWGAKITYLRETKPLGTAGSLQLLPRFEARYPIFVTNCDILTNLNFWEVILYHLNSNSVATMVIREHEIVNPFGVVDMDGPRISGFREKPVYREVINAGMYVLSNESLIELIEDRYCDMPQLFEELRNKGEKTVGYQVTEDWLDIGKPEDIPKAIEFILQSRS